MSGLAGKGRRLELVAVRILDEGRVIQRHRGLSRPRRARVRPTRFHGFGVECVDGVLVGGTKTDVDAGAGWQGLKAGSRVQPEFGVVLAEANRRRPFDETGEV